MSDPQSSPPSRRGAFYYRAVGKSVATLPQFLQDDLRKFCDHTSMEFSLRKLQEKGFQPRNVVDCGAYVGNWTRMIKRMFPSARVVMCEPQQDKRPLLTKVQEEFSGSVEYVNCLLGPESKAAVSFFEMESGSSVLEEVTSAPRRQVTLPMRMLDDVLREKQMADVSFLKLDVQGYELEVLKGATAAMKSAEAILMEISLLPFNQSAPLFDEVIRFMRERGFFVYDICNFHRHQENTLFQIDILFVPAESRFRKVDFVG